MSTPAPKVVVFLQGRLDEPAFTPPREDVVDRFETRRLPTLRTLLEHLRESGLYTVLGCTGSLGAVEAEPHADSLMGKGPVDGWALDGPRRLRELGSRTRPRSWW